MNKIYQAFQSITPNNIESIKEQAQLREGKVDIYMEPKRRSLYYKVCLIACVCVIGFSIFSLRKDHTVFATVGFDVNPSIELNIDEEEKVIEVLTYNDDGQKIIGDMKLEGSHVDVAVNALIGSMLKEGYIDELKNSLLISVIGDNKENNEKIRQRVSQDIDGLLKDYHVQGSIMSQNLQRTTALEDIAKKYHISIGKAELIQTLIEKKPTYTFENLKDLSVHDLNVLLISYDVNNIQVDGEVSTSQYLNQNQIKSLVEKDAKVTQPVYKEIQLDSEDGMIVYEVEFVKDGIEYEYELNALTGDILKKEIEKEKKSVSSKHLSESEAKTIAMNHMKVSQVEDYSIKKEYDDGVYEYKVELINGNKKYEYKIDAVEGTILDYEVEKITTSSNQKRISYSKARSIALQHAKLSMNQVSDMDVELDDNHYEVSFKAKGYEYDYEINVFSGKIIDYEKEKDD